MRFLAFVLLAIVTVSGNDEKRICKPGTLTKVDCNDCICSKDGTSHACTMMLCKPKSFSYVRLPREATKEDGQTGESSLRGKKICEPGVASKVDCNSCICSKDGTFQACTLMLCLPADLFNAPAHRETRGHLGQAGKTSAESSKLVPNSSILRRKRQVSHNRPCEAGKQFKIYCNTCSCGSDGFSVACTRMHCREGMYNEDGSLKSLN